MFRHAKFWTPIDRDFEGIDLVTPCGEPRDGGAKESSALQSRLRQHYVAMTRPSHLLCLAMREDSLADKEIEMLKDRGWRLARVSNEGAEWL